LGTHDQRRSIRLSGYDYRLSGAYFVTVCTHLQQITFGEVLNDEMRLNRFGRVVETLWKRITARSARIALNAFIVMPNHLHAVILILPQDDPTPRKDGTLPATTAGAGMDLAIHITSSTDGDVMDLGRLVTCESGSLGATVGNLKAVVTRRINDMRHSPGGVVWQRNYYERIVRNDAELGHIHAYIAGNPACWLEDRFWDE
jgi:putative transposase